MLKSLLDNNFTSIKRLFIAYSCLTFISLGTIFVWLVGKSYSSYVGFKTLAAERAISEIDIAFSGMIDYSESIMKHIAQQIEDSQASTEEIKEILTSFGGVGGSKNSIQSNLSISMFSWVNKKNLVTINSEYGMLISPYNLSQRQYLKSTIKYPGKIQIGSPVIGRVSGHQVIPVGIGVRNPENGVYIGTIIMGFSLDVLINRLKKIVSNKDLDFAIISKSGEVILESTSGIFSEDSALLKNASAGIKNIKHDTVISQFSLLALNESYLIARTVDDSYLIVSGYQNLVILKGLISTLLPYILGFIILFLLFFAVWYALKNKLVTPIIKLSNVSRMIAQDSEDELEIPESEVEEIIELTNQLKSIERYKLNLLQAKKSQERFFANMSHELRTPLNGILNFAFMMKKEMFGKLDQEYKEMACDIHSSGSHLLNLVNDILDFSKMDIGKMKIFEEAFDPKEEVKTAIKIALSDSEKYGEKYFESGEHQKVKVNSEISIVEKDFYGDRRMFKQILLNLLSNASKFVDRGSITLKLYNLNEDLVLEVIDTGIGIKKEDLEKLVVEFGQVGDGYYRGKKQGTGLGLFLVKKMTELHQGKFEISSTYNQGTTVRIIFPAARLIAKKVG